MENEPQQHDLTPYNKYCSREQLNFQVGDSVVFLMKCAKCFELVEDGVIKPNQVMTIKSIKKHNRWITLELNEIPDTHFAAVMFHKKI